MGKKYQKSCSICQATMRSDHIARHQTVCGVKVKVEPDSKCPVCSKEMCRQNVARHMKLHHGKDPDQNLKEFKKELALTSASEDTSCPPFNLGVGHLFAFMAAASLLSQGFHFAFIVTVREMWMIMGTTFGGFSQRSLLNNFQLCLDSVVCYAGVD